MRHAMSSMVKKAAERDCDCIKKCNINTGYYNDECQGNKTGACYYDCSNTFCDPQCSANEKRKCCSDFDCKSTIDNILRCDNGTCTQNPSDPVKCPDIGQSCWVNFEYNRCCGQGHKCWSDYDCETDQNYNYILRCIRDNETDTYGTCQPPQKCPTPAPT